VGKADPAAKRPVVRQEPKAVVHARVAPEHTTPLPKHTL
jgi:hypothetical protein